MQENLRSYDLPLREHVLDRLYPEYKNNPDKYGVDLIPKNPTLKYHQNKLIYLPDIELQVATYWRRRKRPPQAILIRKRKAHLLRPGVVILTFSAAMMDYAAIRGESAMEIISQIPIELSPNPKDASDEGWWIPMEHFARGQVPRTQ